MNKMQMAHDFAMNCLKNPSYADAKTYNIISSAWTYADAMQAEADKRKRSNKEAEEWQPNWSVAPDTMVQYFAVDENGTGGWYISKPELCFDHWYWSDYGERLEKYDDADNFGYTGNWQESLRKRPK